MRCVVEAGHPVPDAAGQRAAEEVLRMAGRLGADDLLLALFSGGGSSLLALPMEGVSLEELRTVTRLLLAGGAPIEDVNKVRKHLSAIQGGRLAAACQAPVAALIISDVTGDQPADIASGPCAADPSTYQDALDVLRRHAADAPQAVLAHLEKGRRGGIPETPKPGDALFQRVTNTVIAGSRQALDAAVAFFQTQRISAVILGADITGEASEAAKVYAAIAKQLVMTGQPWPRPVALLSGGECTVTVGGEGGGRGGRCCEFLLSLGVALGGEAGVWALACDTDGIDGTEQNAGAILTPDMITRAKAAGIDPKSKLAEHDSWGAFQALGDLVTTGPTRTNVNDYRVILVL
jgi:hydroxypyruvate reductase